MTGFPTRIRSTNSNPVYTYAVSAGIAARQAGRPITDVPASWGPRAGLIFGVLSDMWLRGYGRHDMTQEETTALVARCKAEWEAEKAKRDPETAAKTASRHDRKRRANQRRRNERACRLGTVYGYFTHGDREAFGPPTPITMLGWEG